MSVGLKGRKTSFPEKSGGVNPYKQFCSGRIWLKKLTGKTLDYLKPSAPKATFETPKNLTHADESAIRTWVQRRLKRSISVSDCFPTFAVT